MIPIILCYIAGTALLVLEVFLPGFGAAGICGILLQLACVVLTFLSYSATMAIVVTAVCAATVALLVFLGVRSLGHGRLDKSGLVLHNSESPEALQEVFGPGTPGQALTPLRPAGTALVKGRRVEVTTLSGFIPAGTSLRVTAVENGKIIVEKQ